MANEIKIVIKGRDESGSAFDSAERHSSHLGEKLMGVGKAAAFGAAGLAAVGIAAAVRFAPSLISAASNLELMDRKARTVFGDSFPKIEAWAKTVGTRMGLTSRQVEGLTAGFADMLKPMGFSTSVAATMAQKFAAMAPILSEWSGGTVDLDQATQALQGALTGEYDSLQALGIPISAAQVQTEALKETGKRNAAALTDQEKAAAALNLVYAGSTDAQKSYAAGNDTLAAKVKEAKVRLAELRDNLIAKVTPWLTTAFTWFNEHWLDIADGLLSIAQGALNVIEPLAGVANVAMRVGAALLAVAAGIAMAKGDFRSANALWSAAKGLNKQAGDVSDLAKRIHDQGVPEIQKMRDKIQALRDKKIAIQAIDRAIPVAKRIQAAIRGMAAYKNVTIQVTQNGTVQAVQRQIDSITGHAVSIQVGLVRGVGARGFASGTNSAPPGWAWVGEQGPELVSMRGGEQVLDNRTSSALSRFMGGMPGFAGGTLGSSAAELLRAISSGRQFYEDFSFQGTSRGYNSGALASGFYKSHPGFDFGPANTTATVVAYLKSLTAAPKSAKPAPATPTRPGQPIVLEVHSGGAKLDDLLVELLRRAVRVRGGNVQFVLGS